MSTNDRTLLKTPEETQNELSHRLDDASDRVVVLAGSVIEQINGSGDVDQEDVDDLQDAVDEVDEALDDIER